MKAKTKTLIQHIFFGNQLACVPVIAYGIEYCKDGSLIQQLLLRLPITN